MSLADKLGDVYTNLTAALDDANYALADRGVNAVDDIFSIGSEIRNIQIIKSSNNINSLVDRSCTEIELTNASKIGAYAFANCMSLTSITIPDSVKSIDMQAFLHCHNLLSITIPNSVTSIGQRAFDYCVILTSITIPRSVTSIGGSSFESTNSLTDIYFLSPTPPSLSNGAFEDWTTIHVPVGRGNAYKSATNWSLYADMIVDDIVV